MKTLKDYSDEQLRHGIDRCEARLSGVMPMGYLTDKIIREALVQYRGELHRRGQTEIEFK